MAKYTVRMEFVVQSADFADIEVEADSKEAARKAAIIEYNNGYDLEYYASNYIETEVDMQYYDDWEVTEEKV